MLGSFREKETKVKITWIGRGSKSVKEWLEDPWLGSEP
jgi:hypothetical protein